MSGTSKEATGIGRGSQRSEDVLWDPVQKFVRGCGLYLEPAQYSTFRLHLVHGRESNVDGIEIILYLALKRVISALSQIGFQPIQPILAGKKYERRACSTLFQCIRIIRKSDSQSAIARTGAGSTWNPAQYGCGLYLEPVQ